MFDGDGRLEFAEVEVEVASVVARRLQIDIAAIHSARTVEEQGFTSLTLADVLIGVGEHFRMDLFTARMADTLSPIMTLNDVIGQITELVTSFAPDTITD